MKLCCRALPVCMGQTQLLRNCPQEWCRAGSNNEGVALRSWKPVPLNCSSSLSCGFGLASLCMRSFGRIRISSWWLVLAFCVGRSLLFSSSALRSIAGRSCHARFCVHVLCLCCRRIFCGRCRWAVWSVSCFLVWPSGVFQCAGRSGGRVWQGNSIANGLAEFAEIKSRCGSVVERNRLSQLRFETDERTSCCVIAFLHLAGQSSCSHMP